MNHHQSFSEDTSVNTNGSVLKIWLQVKFSQMCNITLLFHKVHMYPQFAGYLIQASGRTKEKNNLLLGLMERYDQHS